MTAESGEVYLIIDLNKMITNRMLVYLQYTSFERRQLDGI